MDLALVHYEREQLIALVHSRMRLKRGIYTLASGRTSHYYVDGRKVTLSAEGAALGSAAGVLLQLAGRPEITAVRGLTLGARPDRRSDAGSGSVGRTWPPAWVPGSANPRPTGPRTSSRDRSSRVPRWRSSTTWRPPAAHPSRQSMLLRQGLQGRPRHRRPRPPRRRPPSLSPPVGTAPSTHS